MDRDEMDVAADGSKVQRAVLGHFERDAPGVH